MSGAKMAARWLARVLAIIATLAGGILGLLLATIGAGLTCFDSCPAEQVYFARLVTDGVEVLAVSAMPGLLAVVVCLTYCAPKRRARVVVVPVLGLLAGCALLALAWLVARQELPTGITVYENALVTFTQWWGTALALFSVGWSVVVARLVWSADVHDTARLPHPE